MSIDLAKEAEKLWGKPERVRLPERDREEKWKAYEEFQRKLLELPKEEVLASLEKLQESFTI